MEEDPCGEGLCHPQCHLFNAGVTPQRSVAPGALAGQLPGHNRPLNISRLFPLPSTPSLPLRLANSYSAVNTQLKSSLHRVLLACWRQSVTLAVLLQHLDIFPGQLES